MSAVEIDLGPEGTGRVLLNGQDVSNLVRGLTFTSEVGYPHGLVLDLTAATVRAQFAEAEVRVDAATHDFLVDLGWTPPAKDHTPNPEGAA